MKYYPVSGPSSITPVANRWSCIRTRDGSYRVYCAGTWVFTAHDADAARRYVWNGLVLG